jgi:hypothetical protein
MHIPNSFIKEVGSGSDDLRFDLQDFMVKAKPIDDNNSE